MKFILIAGLPCSGKTFLGNSIPNSVLIDDIEDEDDIDIAIKNNPTKDIVITSPFFCYKEIRNNAIKKLSQFKLNIEWLFFENNPEKCLNNYNYRRKLGDKRKVKDFISQLSKIYFIPDGIKPLKIWQENQ